MALVNVDGHDINVSHLEKVFYPETGFTKGEVLDYYAKIGPVLVPHLRHRPITLKRYPEGVGGAHFYEKDCPASKPAWLGTVDIPRVSRDEPVHFCSLNDLPSLIWAANRGSLELHLLLCTGEAIDEPSFVTFDLDPGDGATFLDCAWVALKLRDLFDSFKLKSFLKTSGNKGLHVYVPLNSGATFAQTRAFAQQVALAMEQAFPERVVSKMAKGLRGGKVFIDWSQNERHKSTVAVYSLRATPVPSVSTPLTWAEVDRFLRKGKGDAFRFSPDAVLKRVKAHGDLFAGVLTLRQRLPASGAAAAPGPAAAPAMKKRAQPRGKHAKEALEMYRQKRDFSVTPEPEGGHPSPDGKERFVIQKHAATHLHYDFRLEADGVLKSWSVPKGPSTQLSVRRLAMRTEDHPLDYARFEGTIPKGEYGGGTVMVWDEGTYVNLTTIKGKRVSLAAGLAKGHITFWLKGKKLNGAWSLIRTGDDPRKWLLVKGEDPGVNFPPDPVAELPNSAVTNRSLDEIASDKRSKVWHSNR